MAQSALAGAPSEGFADLVDQVMPSVVSVQAKYTPANVTSDSGATNRQFHFGFPPGSPFEQFFKNQPGKPAMPFRGPRSRGGTSQGSGFVISDDGYLVTNNHVIKDASEVSVKFSDGREYDARVIGTDPKTDLALLKINSDDTFKALKFAEAQPRVGDWIIAVGNPFGLGGTVTTGIVSAAGRDIGAGPYDDFLQIDAPINRGNSGGPAFNLKVRLSASIRPFSRPLAAVWASALPFPHRQPGRSLLTSRMTATSHVAGSAYRSSRSTRRSPTALVSTRHREPSLPP
jgi:serine protease Do